MFKMELGPTMSLACWTNWHCELIATYLHSLFVSVSLKSMNVLGLAYNNVLPFSMVT